MSRPSKGGGKGKFGKGGGGKYGGGSTSSVLGATASMGPVLKQPPLYPPELMKHLPPPTYPPGKEDCDLLSSHRNLVRFWKTSCFFVPGPMSISQSSAEASTQDLLHGDGPADLDAQMRSITQEGGVHSGFFPAELLLRSQLKVKGRPTEKSIVDALKRLEAKEGKRQERREAGGDDDKMGEVVEDADDVDDEDFGDDDDLGRYGDFEDGMGNDFDDDGGGGDGEGEF